MMTGHYSQYHDSPAEVRCRPAAELERYKLIGEREKVTNYDAYVLLTRIETRTIYEVRC